MLRRTGIISLMVATVVCTAATVASSQNANMNKVKRERQAVLRNMNETSGKIKDNKQQTKQSLRELNRISSEIYEHRRSIDRIQSDVNESNVRIKKLGDSISMSSARIMQLRKNYAAAVRKMRIHTSSFDQLMFLFSSSSVHEAYRRMRYLRQFAKWRDRQSVEIHDAVSRLERQKNDVVNLKDGQVRRAVELSQVKSSLEKKQIRQNEVIADLRREGGELQRQLDEQSRKAEALDRELDRLIAIEEQKAAERRRRAEEARRAEEKRKAQIQAEAKRKEKARADEMRRKQQAETSKSKDKKNKNKKGKNSSKPDVDVPVVEEAPKPITITPQQSGDIAAEREERALSGSFESNKGRLPYPVAGSCRVIRKFGRQPHPELKHVMTNNGGIDIEAPKGATAHAVFGGKVSAVFRQDGYNMVVMVRHGKYLTIYVNLSEIYVKVGQTLRINQPIGKISSDIDRGGKAVLHFEVRREKQKLNPAEWLR